MTFYIVLKICARILTEKCRFVALFVLLNVRIRIKETRCCLKQCFSLTLHVYLPPKKFNKHIRLIDLLIGLQLKQNL